MPGSGSKSRILLACPVSQYKEYVIWEWLQHVDEIIRHSLMPVDVLLVDNSHNRTWCEKLKKIGYKVLHLKPRKMKNIEYMTACQNIIRDHVILGGYDYWMSLECDVFPPVHIINHLWGLNKAIVGMPYFIDVDEFSTLMIQVPEMMGSERTFRNLTTDESFYYVDGTLKRSASIGVGCTLIDRNVLIAAGRFHIDKRINVHADVWFYADLMNMGIPVYLDTSFVVTHKNQNWAIINGKEQARKRCSKGSRCKVQ